MKKVNIYTFTLEDVRDGESTQFHGKPISISYDGEQVKVKYFGMDKFLPIEVNPRIVNNCIFISAMRPSQDISDVLISRHKLVEILKTIGARNYAKFILSL